MRAFHQQAQSVIGHFGIAHNIYMTTPDGQQVINTLLPYGSDLPRTNNMGLVRRAAATGKLAVSDIFHGAVVGRPLVAVAVPVLAEGKVVFVLAATISPAQMSRLLVNSQTPSDWIISVHDSKAKFIARTRDIERLIGQPSSDDIRAAMAAKPAGTLEGTTKEGIRVIAAYTKSDITGWTVSVGIPKTKLLTELNLGIAATVILTTLAFAIGLFAATSLAVRIRQAITALLAPAEALSRSEPIQLPPETFMETHVVALALQRTSERLRISEYAAQHDPLTGLVNRSFLSAALPNYLNWCDRNRSELAILYIDLDGFKAVNDALGHPAGDEVLCVSACRIIGAVRGADISIRLGGDEFAVVLHDSSEAGARQAAATLLGTLSREVQTQFGRASVSASIGIALYPGDAADLETLLIKADGALYQAKRAGKNCFAFASGLH